MDNPEIARLLQHPDPTERALALKLDGVDSTYLLYALHDPEIGAEVVNHPGIDSDLLLEACKLPHCVMDAAQHPLFGAAHMQAAFENCSDEQKPELVNFLASHSALDGDTIQKVYNSGHGSAGLVAHPKTPTGVLLDAITKGNPELQAVAAGHANLPTSAIAEAFQNPNELCIVMAGNSGFPADLAKDILRHGYFQTNELWKDIRGALLANPVIPDDIVAIALYDIEPHLSFVARQRLGQLTEDDIFDQHHCCDNIHNDDSF